MMSASTHAPLTHDRNKLAYDPEFGGLIGLQDDLPIPLDVGVRSEHDPLVSPGPILVLCAGALVSLDRQASGEVRVLNRPMLNNHDFAIPAASRVGAKEAP